MPNNKKIHNKIFYYEFFGVLFVFLSTIVLKLVYSYFPINAMSILVGAVNDSIWENIKIMLIPYLFWFAIESCLRLVPFKNLLVSKTISLYSIIIISTLLFRSSQSLYLYDNISIKFIITLIVIVFAFLISYKLMFSNLDFALWNTLSAFMIILVIVMLLGFTINPPQMWIFKDYCKDIYGICIPAAYIF